LSSTKHHWQIHILCVRIPFTFTEYHKQPWLHQELAISSAALVTFTLGAYELTNGAAISYRVKLGVSVNVKSILLLSNTLSLTNPTPPQFSNAPPHLSVLSETELGEYNDEHEA